MPRTRPEYPPELRQKIVELARAGRSAASLAREFEPTENTIRNWVAQADRDAGVRSDGLTTDERKELTLLRREVRTLREEREILKKAAAWFVPPVRGTDPWPSRLVTHPSHAVISYTALASSVKVRDRLMKLSTR